MDAVRCATGVLALALGACIVETSVVAGSTDPADAGGRMRDALVDVGTVAGQDAGPDAPDVTDAGERDGGAIADDSGVEIDACVPVTETCDGTDEDCDAAIDEDGACAPCTRDVYGGHVYLFCVATETWDEARVSCTSRGYDLVVIEDASEEAWLWSIAGPLSGDEYFIGLHDRTTEGRFEWVDGTVAREAGVDRLYTAWTSNAPDDIGGEDCVELDRGRAGSWEDVPCDQRQSFVCEVAP